MTFALEENSYDVAAEVGISFHIKIVAKKEKDAHI
jgi:hypothetical protein